MSYSDKKTDYELAKLENRIKKVYKDASKDLDETWKQYIQGYDEVVDGKKVHHKSLKERYAQEYKAYQEGKYTKQQFNAWYQAQIGRGRRWKELQNEMTKRMVDADKVAASYINDVTPGIYSLNANFSAFEIEKGSGIAFNLVNEQAIREIMDGKNFTEFRTLSVNPKRDYQWNSERIQNAVMSGILQGNSIDKIADRFYEVMGSNMNAAIRNARTAVTSAQNGGRQATFNKAQKMGIYMQKEWIATHDNRTRDSHIQLDGVRVENDNPFPNGCMFPADPNGEPAEVYNCRCTMRGILPKYNGGKRMTAWNGGANTQASYAKWVFEKAKGKNAPFTTENNSGNINTKLKFNTKDDPIKEIFGRAEDSHPEEVARYIKELKEAGAELIRRDYEDLAYTPNFFPGKAGQIHLSKDCSIGAWRHEMQHFYSDKKLGYPGYEALMGNNPLHYQWEKEAYAIEIEMAKKAGREDIVKRLRQNRKSERKTIYEGVQ